MGLFNLFKKKKEKEETLGKLFDEIFPGGKIEIAKDVSQLSETLNHDYSLSNLEMQYMVKSKKFCKMNQKVTVFPPAIFIFLAG